MKLQEAKEILRAHNIWRRFNSETIQSPEMIDPKKIGIAIDVVVNSGIVSGNSLDFYNDLLKLINDYCDKGLKKTDLVAKMEYAIESCKMS